MRRRLIVDAILAFGAFVVVWGSAFGLLLGGLRVRAEVSAGLSPSYSVTSTSATTFFSNARNEVTLINDTVSANELYARVFWCGETAAAATTTSPIRLEPGEWLNVRYSQGEGGNGGYCAVSYVASAAETATLRVLAK